MGLASLRTVPESEPACRFQPSHGCMGEEGGMRVTGGGEELRASFAGWQRCIDLRPEGATMINCIAQARDLP